jgi:hypothetical protein
MFVDLRPMSEAGTASSKRSSESSACRMIFVLETCQRGGNADNVHALEYHEPVADAGSRSTDEG